MARLLFRDSQGREGTVELSPAETVYVGRGLECAIRTDDGMVSRRHSQIRMEGGRFVVEDLGSANGTRLRDQPLSPHVRVSLAAGEAIAIGTTVLIVQRQRVLEEEHHVLDRPVTEPHPVARLADILVGR